MIKIYLHFYKKWQNKISPSKEKKKKDEYYIHYITNKEKETFWSEIKKIAFCSMKLLFVLC